MSALNSAPGADSRRGSGSTRSRGLGPAALGALLLGAGLVSGAQAAPPTSAAAPAATKPAAAAASPLPPPAPSAMPQVAPSAAPAPAASQAPGAAPGEAPPPAMRPTGKATQVPLPPRSFSIAVHPGPRLPADFAIGPLADLATAAETEPVGIARAFLTALLAGKLELSRIAEDRRDLARSLARPLLEAKAPRGYRIGTALVAGEAASLSVRLELEPADSVGARLRAWGGGELRLRADSASWYIDDFSLDSRPPAGDEDAEAWEPPLPL